MGKLVELGSHDNMSPADALALANRKAGDIQDVVILYVDKEGVFTVSSSSMHQSMLNLMLDAAKQFVMERVWGS